MTIKDVLLELINKYGEEFNWYLLLCLSNENVSKRAPKK